MDDLKEHSYCLAKSRPPQNYKVAVIDRVESVVSVCVQNTSTNKRSNMISQTMILTETQWSGALQYESWFSIDD